MLDVVFLSRLQFALTAAFHFIFVPLSIGLGLIMAIHETQYYRTRKPEDAAATCFWLKIFTVTFAVGVATGITMEFSFGTNWATYSRFVGDIFGAPLAAEALLAFFLESVFLGVLLFGRKKVSPRFYCISAWLVSFGSAFSALWILIANSWMQTPYGAELSADGTRAVITNFFAAAFNPSTGARYTHTVLAVLIMGAFFAIGIAGYYFLKKRHTDFAHKTLKVGLAVGVVATCALLVSAHNTAVQVSEEQPTKLAMMEGQYGDEVPPLYLFGYVDEQNEKVVAPLAIPGGTSFLASGSWDTEYPGLNSLAKSDKFGALDASEAPANLVFQSYHLMVALFGVIALVLILAIVFLKRKKIAETTWMQKLLIISPLFPFLAIQAGWVTAEVGRQPWVVYPAMSSPQGIELETAKAISESVSAPEVLATVALFILVYAFLFIAWVRLVNKFVKQGPVPVDEDSLAEKLADSSADKVAAASAKRATAKAGE